MQYTRNYDFAAGTTIIADQIDQELNGIATVINGNISTDNIADGSLTTGKFTTSTNPETRLTETLKDFVYSGLTLSPTSGWANLLGTIASGTSYIRGIRVASTTQTNHAFTASKDTYVDLDKNNNFTYVEVANGAGIPAVTANSLRIMKIVTNGSAITSWTDLRPGQWITVGDAGAPAFENSWVNYSATFNSAAFMKDQLGFVHLRGLVKSGTDEAVIFTLPTGFRPGKQELFVVMSNNLVGRLDITTAGAVDPEVTANNFISLDNLSFYAEA